ncbi:hypothetical protein [Clostridium sp. ZBS4]|nr:hypothetical protein [Clostridium sp. ZBS4]
MIIHLCDCSCKGGVEIGYKNIPGLNKRPNKSRRKSTGINTITD